MPNELVGLENVPNCYIARIVLDDNTTKSFTCSVNLELFDATEGDRTIWGYNSLFSDFLKVALIETRRPSLSQRLTEGTVSPLPSELQKNAFFDDTTKIHEFPIKQFKKLNGAYVKKVKFTVPSDTENLSIFAVCYIDTKALSGFLQLDMTGELSSYHGALVSERVLARGTAVKTSTVFYKPDNTVWSGPVHQHDGMYMEGSRHTAAPHSVLRTATVQNLKLVDRRGRSFSDRQRDSIQNNPVISNLHLSVNNNDDLNGMFFVNMKQLLLTRTKLGTKIADLSARMFNDFLNQIQISQMIVKRFNANVRLVKGKMGSYQNSTLNTKKSVIIASSTDIAPYSLRPQELLKERYLFTNRNIRAFEFTDDSKTRKNKGNFKYSVELTIKDKSQEYIDNIILQLRSSLSRMKEIHHALSRKGSYDYEMRRLRDGVFVPAGVSSIIEVYYNNLQYFKDFNDTEKRRLINEKIKGFSVASYNPTTSEKFIADLDDLSSLMFERFGVRNEYNSKTPKTTKTTFMPARIFLNKTFEDNVNFFDYNRSYNYIPPVVTKGLPVLRPEDLLSRGSQELSRFYYDSNITTAEELKSLPKEMQSALTTLESVKISYFSPLSLQYRDETVSIENVDSLDLKKTNDLVAGARQIATTIRRTSSQTTTGRTRAGKKNNHGLAKNLMRGFGFSSPSLKTEVQDTSGQNEEEAQKTLIESVHYLGENSEFINVDNEFTPPATEDTQLAVGQIVATFNNKPTRGSAAYNFASADNVVSYVLDSARYSAEDVANQPIQTKALINSRSNSVKNNILQSPVDPLKEVSSLNAFEIVFKAIQKIEKITGFATDSSGVEIVTQPIFEMLKTSDVTEDSTLLCRMRYYENAPMDLGPSANLMFPVRNQTFVVSNKDLSTPQYSEIPSLTISNISTVVSPIVKYSTTNIVTQRLDSSYVKSTKIIGTSQTTNQRVGSRVSNRGQVTDSSSTRRQRRQAATTSTTRRSGGGGY
tara:strand:+ start:1422 stop:4379 length:2958 start_codon:yes stop_codon:yes gene_type:complete